MSEEDYRLYVKHALDSLKELMGVEFLAVKNTQSESHRFSQEQIDHVYEVIKIISKKIDDSSERAARDFSTVRIDMQTAAIAVGVAKDVLLKTINEAIHKQEYALDIRFRAVESVQAKLWGGVATLAIFIPLITGIIIYFIDKMG